MCVPSPLGADSAPGPWLRSDWFSSPWQRLVVEQYETHGLRRNTRERRSYAAPLTKQIRHLKLTRPVSHNMFQTRCSQNHKDTRIVKEALTSRTKENWASTTQQRPGQASASSVCGVTRRETRHRNTTPLPVWFTRDASRVLSQHQAVPGEAVAPICAMGAPFAAKATAEKR